MTQQDIRTIASATIPPRLEKALYGLVKSGILSADDVAILVAQAVVAAPQADLTSARSSGTSWIDYLWDQVTILRAQAEADRSRTDRSRRYQHQGGRRGRR